MPLASGVKLGPYEILSQLGAGGMGEVYRARDTRLDRTVAIKVLPDRLSQNPEQRRRLEQEARTISKMSHPNICTLHDVGHQDGIDFLVFEFVEGKTLRQVLASGGLSIHRIIPIAVQIADGLAKAHETGVIHRDLKPENLMITPEFVKILDFGLAKLIFDCDFSQMSPTAEVTEPGVLLGTIGYMSPEQASGRPLDFRSDQFSFGLVLYEMATGRHAFQKRAPAQTLLAIMREEPQSISSLNSAVPPPFCWVVERCLAKDPEKRYFSTRDLARDLAAIGDRLSDLQSNRADSRSTNLPIFSTAFVGREKELAQAKEMLIRPDVRLVTVTGPGGIGKSRLAFEVARDVAERFPAGIYFVPLAAICDPALITFSIAQAFGVRETGGRTLLETLRDHLQAALNMPALLVIDNFEHLLSAAPILAELLALAPRLKLIVTSRAPLRVYSEHEFPVPPLALPDPKSLPPVEALYKYPAISLFTQRAAAVKPDFTLTEENAAAVADICARLDGLPLAIELAAARAKILSPAALRTRLASRLELLTGGARDLPARQQTLRKTIDWSHDFLTVPEQKLFRRLSVFAGGCTLDGVESVCDVKNDLELSMLDGMASLVDKSLLRQTEQPDGEPRFSMLETIREYGSQKLADSGEESLTRRAHAAYCLVLAEEGASENHGANLVRWLDRFEIEHDNFRTALDWLTETGNADWGMRLGVALFRFWELHEHFAEGRDRLGKLLQLSSAAQPTTARLRSLFAAGVLAVAQRDYLVADCLIQESLQIGRTLDDKRSIAASLNALAVNARDRADLPGSRVLFEESLLLWRELEDAQAVARALSNLATIVKLQGDYPQALSLYDECLSIFDQLEDRTGIAWTLNHQGDTARDQGDCNAACSLYEKSLAIFRQLDDRWGIAASLADLGHLARKQRDFRSADSLYRESILLFQALDHKRGVARLLESFACAAAVQSQPERALRLAGAAAALRQSIGSPLTTTEQEKLNAGLEFARRELTSTKGRTAWLEGWVMPVEKALDEVLRSASASRST